VTATSRQACAYQWRFNQQPLAGATASNFDVIAAQCTNAGSYDVVVSNDSGSSTSVVAVLTVVSPPGCSVPPANGTVVTGQSATFRVTATNSCGGGFKYQWQKGGASISGATASSLVIANAQTSDAGSYAVVVTNLGGSFTSAVATLTVIVPPAISSPPAGQMLARGADAAFSVTATGTAPLRYQWRFAGAAVPDATDSAYTRTGIQCRNAGTYDVIVTNAGGSITSSAASLVVVSPPVLLAPPTNQSVAAGQTAAFSFSVTNDCGGTLTYQWQYAGTNLSGATASTLTLTNAQSTNAGAYTAVAANFAGAITSAVATLAFTNLPLLVLAPLNLDFGPTFIGRTAGASLVVSNAGVVGLSGTATIIGGPFSIEGGSAAGLSVPALGSTNLVIQFQPLVAGVFSNAIVFATDGGSATNSLSGVGADWPVILPTAPAGTSSVFCFSTIPGKTYTIEYKDFLEDLEWLPLQTVAGDGSTHSITNSISATFQRFYRLNAQ
jgi:hypothetical protein